MIAIQSGEFRTEVERLFSFILEFAVYHPRHIERLLVLARGLDDSPKTAKMVSDLTVQLVEHWDREAKEFDEMVERDAFAAGIISGNRLLPGPEKHHA